MARLVERDGISKEEAANILGAQMPIEDKKQFADFIVDNEGTLEETRAQVERLWEELTTMQRKGGAST
jgi:dephospho-CoA kinase